MKLSKVLAFALVAVAGIACGVTLSFFVPMTKEVANQHPRASLTLIPEFAPTDSVLVSEILFNENFNGQELAEKILETKARLIVAVSDPVPEEQKLHWIKKHRLDRFDPNMIQLLNLSHDTQWIRDYGPISVLVKGGQLPPRLSFVDWMYKKEMDLDDTVPYQLALFFNSDVQHIPLDFDGGNFLTDGKHCYMTADVRKDLTLNAKDMAADRPKAQKLIKDYFQNSVGCEEVVIIENAPHEHIDMWAKIVDKNTVLINEITAETINYMIKKDGYVPKDVIEVRDNLDAMAERFSAYLKVERVPMPIPYRNTFRTYTNSILVNGHAIVPRYQTFGWQGEEYPDAELVASYHKAVRQVYERHGYKVDYVRADGLIFNGGALHCVAHQIPEVKF